MRIACLVLLGCLSLSCEQGKVRGTQIGTYHVQGSLLENTCGDTALPAEASLDFQVEIRRLGPKSGLWILGGPPGTEGTLTEEGAFVFVRTSAYAAVAPETQADVIRREEPADYLSGAVLSETPNPGCAFSVEERVEGSVVLDAADAGALDGGSLAPALTATNKITVVPTLGSDCRAALAENGGPFYAFPCFSKYMLSAERLP